MLVFTQKQMISTSELHEEHSFGGQNTQHLTLGQHSSLVLHWLSVPGDYGSNPDGVATFSVFCF